mgnify:CR=1 FL=1
MFESQLGFSQQTYRPFISPLQSGCSACRHPHDAGSNTLQTQLNGCEEHLEPTRRLRTSLHQLSLTACLLAGGTLSDCGHLFTISRGAGCLWRGAGSGVRATLAVGALGAVSAGFVAGNPSGGALTHTAVGVHHQGVLTLGALVATGGGVQHTGTRVTSSRATRVHTLEQGAGNEGVCRENSSSSSSSKRLGQTAVFRWRSVVTVSAGATA